MSSRSGWEVVGVLAGIAGVAGVVAFSRCAHGALPAPQPQPPQPQPQPEQRPEQRPPQAPQAPQAPQSPAPAPSTPSVQPPSVEAWRPYVRMLAPAFGLAGPGWEAFIMQYITMESAGQPCSIGFPGWAPGDGIGLDPQGQPLESGIAQLMSPHDIALAKTTVAKMRAACSTDVRFPEITPAVLTAYRDFRPAAATEHAKAVSIINAARARAQTQMRPLTEAEKLDQVTALLTFLAAIVGIVDRSFAEHGVTWPKSSADYLAMIKGYHAGQSFPTAGVAAAKRALGHAPRTWGEFASGYLSTLGDANLRARHAHALDNARRAGAGSGLPWLAPPATAVSGWRSISSSRPCPALPSRPCPALPAPVNGRGARFARALGYAA